jgi:hypothetical protein
MFLLIKDCYPMKAENMLGEHAQRPALGESIKISAMNSKQFVIYSSGMPLFAIRDMYRVCRGVKP